MNAAPKTQSAELVMNDHVMPSRHAVPASRRSLCPLCLCGQKPFRSLGGFTLVEMLVVIGIIALVAVMAIPMMTPYTRARKVEQVAETVKTACILARSKAIQQRKKFNVTILQDERLVFLTEYDALAATTDGGKYVPAAGDYFCAHFLNNYHTARDANGKPLAPATAGEITTAIDLRASVLDRRSRDQGFVPRTLPEGCRFDLDSCGAIPCAMNGRGLAWSYVFLSTGAAWTADTAATNDFGTNWTKTTYLNAAGQPTGPLMQYTDGREVKAASSIIVYAMTGQAMRPDIEINR